MLNKWARFDFFVLLKQFFELQVEKLILIVQLFVQVWVDYFSNRKNDAVPRPTQEMLCDKIGKMLPNSGWSGNEIEMLEKIACPIIREGKKIKEQTKKTQQKGQKTIS